MNTRASIGRRATSRHAGRLPELPDLPSEELCAALFASLPRADQRLKARQYLSGLLAVPGRKSIRNIAALAARDAHADESAVEQSLHHFISSSTWDWAPIRTALAARAGAVQPPLAWVVRPLFIAKAGEHSVGVARQPAPERGQELNGQLAFGAWAVGDTVSVPVQWRLRLPELWLTDPRRRRRAEIPAGAEAESLDECATATALSVPGLWQTPARPVVLDLPPEHLHGVLRDFAKARVPLLTRVRGTTRLTAADRALPGYRAGAAPAHQIMESLRGRRRPLSWRGPGAGSTARRTSLVAAVRVRLPQRGSGAGSRTRAAVPLVPLVPQPPSELLLVGEWQDGGKASPDLWLASPSLAPAPAFSSVGELLRLARLTRRVARDEERIGERVGMRDFEGRSFNGWHRHMTLASAAHAVSALATAADARAGAGDESEPLYSRGLSA
ncbi:IS701 family transposase [Streptomyces sp. NBC_01530]|uniref:IS701 family transposase n=1 Tax=Streptomyces sp. NBC_01530 TaxID=2903895 RepID=UPI00386455AE